MRLDVLGDAADVTTRAKRWWAPWAFVNVVVLVAALREQLDLITAPCSGCPTVLRLTEHQVRDLEAAGGTLGQYKALVVVVVVLFAVSVGWLAWVLVYRSGDDAAAIGIGYLVVSVAAIRWVEDAAMLRTSWLSPLGRTMAVANYVAPLVLFARFPDGRWQPRWSRAACCVIAAWAAAVYLTPLADGLAAGREPVSSIDGAVFLTGLAMIIAWQVARFRSSDADIRRSIRWVVMAAIGALVVFSPLVIAVRLGVEADPRVQLTGVGLAVLTILAILAAATAAIVRHHLWNVDVIVSRVVVYGSSTAVVATAYVLLVWVASRTAVPRGEAIAVAAAIVVALVLAPLQRRFRAMANRLVYGRPPTTDALLTPFGDPSRLEPAGILSATAEVIRTSLELPYVAFAVPLPGSGSVAAIAGAPPSDGQTVVLPVTVGTEQVGTLTVATRRGQRRFTRQDRQTLAATAAQAGATAAMVRVASDLQRSREQLVTAREEERRRIRRDLHDGLGPTLAGVAHRIERTRSELDAHHRPGATALELIEADVRTALDDVRRLVRGLRPPVLDQLGVLGAVEVLAQDLGLDIEIEGDSPPDLSAAVELAAYRIAAEALTNAHRHGRAARVRVTLAATGIDLTLTVHDDGTGLVTPLQPGVGLQSMRERAAELGGTCTVEPAHRGGTVVTASLPLMPDGAR